MNGEWWAAAAKVEKRGLRVDEYKWSRLTLCTLTPRKREVSPPPKPKNPRENAAFKTGRWVSHSVWPTSPRHPSHASCCLSGNLRALLHLRTPSPWLSLRRIRWPVFVTANAKALFCSRFIIYLFICWIIFGSLTFPDIG